MDRRNDIGIALALSLSGRCLAAELCFDSDPFYKESVRQGRFGDKPAWSPGQPRLSNGPPHIHPSREVSRCLCNSMR